MRRVDARWRSRRSAGGPPVPLVSGAVKRRNANSGRRARSRRHERAARSERWLLLVMVVGFVIVTVGTIGPWPFAADTPGGTEPLTMAEARAANAAVPIEPRLRVRAAPYRFRGDPAERVQAAECLATAALYEIGDDRRGQRAVIQVILNRVRAAGFPKTVCGVVYQGSARATGCQFSFTCDRSFERRPVRDGWATARAAARRALSGAVFPDVGGATDYHADWVVPYWRDSLTKVAQVGPHLFYVRVPPHRD